MAAFSWASLSLLAIVILSLVILILSSGPCVIFRSDVFGVEPIKFSRSSFRITPFFPDPSTSLRSIFFSVAIFLAEGEIILRSFSIFFSSFTSVKIKGSSSFSLFFRSTIFTSGDFTS